MPLTSRHYVISLFLLLFGWFAFASPAAAEEPRSAKQDEAPTLATVADLAATSDSLAALVGRKFSRGPAGERAIALTFDDGPHPTRTAQVLAILQSEDIPATFFMVGEMVEDYPQVALQVADAGFEIGSHSFTHPNLTKKDIATIRREVIGTQDLIEQVTGRRPRLFRPPGGFVNDRVRQVCREDGLVIVMWSVDPRDWSAQSTPETIRARTLNEIHNGAIVCMHDVKKNTVEALPGLIAELKAQGYRFTTVGRLIEAAAREKKNTPREAVVDPSEPLIISLDETQPAQ